MSCTEIDAYREASSAIKKFLGNYINTESSIIEYKFIEELLTGILYPKDSPISIKVQKTILHILEQFHAKNQNNSCS